MTPDLVKLTLYQVIVSMRMPGYEVREAIHCGAITAFLPLEETRVIYCMQL